MLDFGNDFIPSHKMGKNITLVYSTNVFNDYISLFGTASPWKLVFMLFVHSDSKTLQSLLSRIPCALI